MKCNGKVKARRPIEQEYLTTLNSAVPLDTWQAICQPAGCRRRSGWRRESPRLAVQNGRWGGIAAADYAGGGRIWDRAGCRGPVRNCGPASENRRWPASGRAE